MSPKVRRVTDEAASQVPKDDLRVYYECLQAGHPKKLPFSLPQDELGVCVPKKYAAHQHFLIALSEQDRRENAGRVRPQGPGYYSRKMRKTSNSYSAPPNTASSYFESRRFLLRRAHHLPLTI